jgi:hypothetical protein
MSLGQTLSEALLQNLGLNKPSDAKIIPNTQKQKEKAQHGQTLSQTQKSLLPSLLSKYLPGRSKKQK